MTTAHKLADELEQRTITRWLHSTGGTPRSDGHEPDRLCHSAAAMLRRQAEQIKELREALAYLLGGFQNAYDAAERGCIEEVLLHCGHHSAVALAALNNTKEPT